MTDNLKASSQRVQDYLLQHGAHFVVRELPDSTRSAEEAARALGCDTAQIAKSLIFKDAQSGRPVLVVASGSNRVCADKIAAATGLKLAKADAKFVREQVGYAIGGVPPVAHTDKVITLLDPDLKRFATLWAAAGTPNSVFELSAEELGSLTAGRWVELAQ